MHLLDQWGNLTMRRFTASIRCIAIGMVIGASSGIALADTSSTVSELTGAGSTFVNPILMRWAVTYSDKFGIKVNYEAIGSGGGIEQIKASTIDFGATDIPLGVKDLSASGLGQFPLVIGGVVPVVNLPGVPSGQIKFTGAVLADIFLGKITTWNDPEITAMNPGLTLPAARIMVVHRSDGSGTTFNFTDYLSKVSPSWKARLGEGASVAWPVGLGAKSSEGVAAYVRQIPNAIGYVEYAYAAQNKMNVGLVQNKAGHFVAPSAASFQAAATTAVWATASDFNLVITDAPGADAYPIAATTFIVMRKRPNQAPHSKAVCDFFQWVLDHGQDQATAMNYAALPPALTQQIKDYWAKNF